MTHDLSLVPSLDLPGTSVRIPQIGLGTWPHVGDECKAAVLSALEIGYRHLDTAERYGNEDAVGTAVRESGVNRKDIFICSKLTNATFGDVTTVREGLDASLERMGFSYLDLYLIHWPNPDRTEDAGTFVQTAASLAEITEDPRGALRAWGVANFTPAHLDALTRHGLKPTLNQVQVDPIVGQPAVLAGNEAAGVLSAAYSPLGRAGNILELAPVVAAADRHGVSPGQAILRWHVQHGRVAVPRSANPERQRENLNVYDFELTADEMTAIDGLNAGAGQRLDPDEYHGH